MYSKSRVCGRLDRHSFEEKATWAPGNGQNWGWEAENAEEDEKEDVRIERLQHKDGDSKQLLPGQ